MHKDTYTHHFFSGSSGLVLPFNKSQFPNEFKDKSRLQYYASLFNSLEINSSFYKLPKNTTLINWADSVSKDFRFSLKVPKSITHSPELNFNSENISEFMKLIGNLGDKNGCLLAQFPPSLSIEAIEAFKNLLNAFKQEMKLSGWKLAIEFRHDSWYDASVHQLLKSYNASVVLHDMKNSETQWSNDYADFIYLRFHGPEPRYRGNYSDEFLKQMAQAIVNWMREGKNVYAYFNNTLGAAFTNLQTLNVMVKDISY